MLKKIIWAILILVLLGISSITVFLLVQKDFIKNQAISSLNKQLDAKIDVQGAIDLSLFSSFPKINLELHKVLIEDKLQISDTLAHVEKLSLSLNPWSLLQKKYIIDEIKVENGFVHLFIDENGFNNFNILKPKDTENTEASPLQLQKIILSNIHIKYKDLQNKLNIRVFTKGSTVAGSFLEENFQLVIVTELYNEHFQIGETQLLSNKNLKGNLKLNYTGDEGCIAFEDNEIYIENNVFIVNGNVCTKTKTLDLHCNAVGDKIQNALALIPKTWLDFQNLDGDGSYSITGDITGFFDNPLIHLDFLLDKGQLNLTENDLVLDNIQAKGSYTNIDNKNGSLSLSSFSLNTKNSTLNGSVIIPDLSRINITTTLNGQLDYSLIKNYLPESFTLESGEIDFQKLHLIINQNKLDSLWVLQKVEGDISLKQLIGRVNSLALPFSCSGDLQGKANYLSALNLDINLGENHLNFDGELKNLIEIILNKDKESNLELGVLGRLESKYFNLNDFIQESTTDKPNEAKEIFFPPIQGSLSISIQKFLFRKLELENVQIAASAKNTDYTFNITNSETLDGKITGVLLTKVLTNDFETNLSCDIQEVDMQKLFLAFDDFGQESFGNKNIKGILTAQLNLSATWNNFTNLNTESFLMQSHIQLKNGELINFSPLTSLAGKLELEQLEHLYFTDLETDVSVKNELISLSLTEIKSNLLSLKTGGTHSFDNDINYQIILNLKNLLAAKFKKNKTTEEGFVNDVMGGINLYITMTGTVDDPIISYDKNSVKEKIKQDFKDEKKEFKNLFKKNEKSEFEKNEIKFEELKEEDKYIDWEEE